jgi:hypothetical protein
MVRKAYAGCVSDIGVLSGGVGVNIAESAVGLGAVLEGSLGTVALSSQKVPDVALHTLAD